MAILAVSTNKDEAVDVNSFHMWDFCAGVLMWQNCSNTDKNTHNLVGCMDSNVT